MPKAAVYEHDGFPTGQDDVGLSGKLRPDAVPNAEAPEGFPQGDFWLGVRSLISGHAVTALRRRQNITHWSHILPGGA